MLSFKFCPAVTCRLILRAAGFVAAIVIVLLAGTSSYCQEVNLGEEVARPIPGAGHDYIHMLAETVNPANGSLSIKIDLPIPKGRGLSLPFAITYNSGSVYHSGTARAGCGTIDVRTNPCGASTYGSDRSQAGFGWSNSLPYATMTYWMGAYPNPQHPPTNGPFCPISSSYVFYDPQGGSHLLNLAALGYIVDGTVTPQCTQVHYGSGNGGTYVPSKNGGDTEVYAEMDASGTAYSFPANTFSAEPTYPSFTNIQFLFPTQIEDRNGNIVKFTVPKNYIAAGTPVIDTLGRSEVSDSNPSSTGAFDVNPTSYTVGGLSYELTYTTTTAHFTAADTQVYPLSGVIISGVNCTLHNSVSESSIPVLSKISLPNGQFYQFKYDSTYGLVNEIDYPDGGWVKYTWSLSSTPIALAMFDGDATGLGGTNAPAIPGYCGYEYQTPVITERQVGYTAGSTAALTQTFSHTQPHGMVSRANGQAKRRLCLPLTT